MHVGTSNEDNREETYESTRMPSGEHALDPDDIEQYGVWVKAGPVDVSNDEESGMQFKMEDLGPDSGDGELTQEEEELLGSLETGENASLDATPNEISVDSLPELGEADDLSIEDLDLSLDEEDSHVEAEAEFDQEEGESLGDAGGLELDLPDSNEEEEPMDIPEGSATILEKIEKDLHSIKEELTALKNEIYSLRGGASKPEQEESREEGESGFFEEDEDETIALTGDELDNILNTADITEQTGQSTASPEENDFVFEEGEQAPEALIDREDILVEEVEPAEAEVLEAPPSAEEPEEPGLDESLADIASLSEGSADELVLGEEQPGARTEDLLDLPQEEEIVLEDITETETPESAESGEETEEIELDLGETEIPEETTFELDEELELSPTEEEDLEASQDLLGDEELTELVEPETEELELEEMESEAASEIELEDFGSETAGETELGDIESEAAGEIELGDFESETAGEIELGDIESEAAGEAEQTVEEPFDFGGEELEPLDLETMGESPTAAPSERTSEDLPEDLKSEIRSILKYMDQLLESLPEEKIEEFANSEYFDVYKRLFEELDLTT